MYLQHVFVTWEEDSSPSFHYISWCPEQVDCNCLRQWWCLLKIILCWANARINLILYSFRSTYILYISFFFCLLYWQMWFGACVLSALPYNTTHPCPWAKISGRGNGKENKLYFVSLGLTKMTWWPVYYQSSKTLNTVYKSIHLTSKCIDLTSKVFPQLSWSLADNGRTHPKARPPAWVLLLLNNQNNNR